MSRKHKGSIWDYLKSVPGLLEMGDDAAIAAARNEYWKMKNRQYQALRRKRGKEIKIALTLKEWQVIADGAKKQNMSVSNFAKLSCMAYLSQTFVVPDVATVRKIEVAFLRALTAIERIAVKEKSSWLIKSNDYEELKDVIQDLRASFKKELRQPDLLLSIISSHPEVWDEIKKIIR
jgi:hypothetical protein